MPQLMINTQDVLDFLQNPNPSYIEIDCTDDVLSVALEIVEDETLILYFDTDCIYPDDYSVIYRDTKFKGAEIESHYVGVEKIQLDTDFSEALILIENYMVSKEYPSKIEVFFSDSCYEGSLNSYSRYDHMSVYGFSNSDFV